MNTKTVISVKTDKVTKEAAQEVAKSMGLNLSTLLNAYLKQFIYTRRVELFAPEQMTPKLEKAILASIKSGVSSQSFTTADDFIEDLNK
jgi:addiction module RelB/DinJ family antitoxin